MKIKDYLKSRGYVVQKEITTGFSKYKKYIVKKKNNFYIVKLCDIKDLKEKEKEMKILYQLLEKNIPVSRPIAIGSFEKWGYLITEYLIGLDGNKILANLDYDIQYKIGINAGMELYRIHAIEPPIRLDSWSKRQAIKYYKKLDTYYRNGLHFKGDKEVISFIKAHMDSMKNRKNVLQHDDFHPGNLIIEADKLSGIIDFERYDWGDAYHDFLKIGLFSRNVSVPFSVGQIHGYFQGDPDVEFWTLYLLYIGMEMISSVNWCLEYFPEQLHEMFDRFHIIREDHAQFTRIVPKWYASF